MACGNAAVAALRVGTQRLLRPQEHPLEAQREAALELQPELPEEPEPHLQQPAERNAEPVPEGREAAAVRSSLRDTKRNARPTRLRKTTRPRTAFRRACRAS